jgi:hypothetical protein
LHLRFVEQHLENALAFDLRRFPEVEPLEVEEIEGVKDHPSLLSARKVSLELREICPPLVDDNHFSVEDRPLDRDIK